MHFYLPLYLPETLLKIWPLYIPCTFVFFFQSDLGSLYHNTHDKLSFAAYLQIQLQLLNIVKCRRLYSAHINMKYDIRIKSNQQHEQNLI